MVRPGCGKPNRQNFAAIRQDSTPELRGIKSIPRYFLTLSPCRSILQKNLRDF
jgi:hypothetical protein